MVEAELLSESFAAISGGVRPSFASFSLPTEAAQPLLDKQITDLKTSGFPAGLAISMNENNQKFPLRVWIIDNSGSMKKDDGSQVLTTPKGGYRVVRCTRWQEMQETVDFHSKMASMVNAPTIFRFLNKPLAKRVPREFQVLHQQQVKEAQDIIAQVEPKGCTPISKRVKEIRANIEILRDELEETESRVAIILATDGLPTNREGECNENTKNEFIAALRSLEGLPIWLVIRLCTQSEEVVEFYNDLDAQLELELEVLDDFFQEAKELYKYNKWINYALPLHRAREMGFHHRMFDLLDERRLTLDEVRQYFEFLFGVERISAFPDPVFDFKGFIKGASRIIDSEPKQYNPIARKDTPWVDLKKLVKAYKGKNCSIM
eukprot:CAMPEP_0202453036 /NCGR_PEP_ID=MMETSP1360-20130828/11109_1 /ASSEMBLY_ACC=CAM_ASM_000848 /TAXON_ID=515479 /ORGANISM="Licmophora paradoxa, Strain CCMP2313" /LENGTH=375 /DNA_ID=CAMNT_0049072025 /DNA_START=121 /DNA_END=1248 /DNA_ORIENTATION=-